MITATLPYRLQDSSKTLDLNHVASCLTKGAAMELYLTPKPGLVDLADSGSHHDLSLPIMEKSIMLVGDYLGEMCHALRYGAELRELQQIGISAEKNMFDRFGTNTHRGYIFLSGIFLTACFRAGTFEENRLRSEITKLSTEFFVLHGPAATNGNDARSRFHAGGIVSEAIQGFPSLFDHALPAYRQTPAESGSVTRASFAMLARLMTVVDDTTALHRCGLKGLQRIQRDGRRLEPHVRDTDDYLGFLRSLNDRYRAMNLTMGGVADMLALSFGYLAMEENGEIIL